MKKIKNSVSGFYLLLLVLAGNILYSQTYTFTPCGATGQLGPSQGQVNTAYASTNLSGNVTVMGTGVQQWTVPATGAYRIEALGASGGSVSVSCSAPGGLGAHIGGDFNLTSGQVLLILVGQKGTSNNSDAGGGGGSFVASSSSVAMLVAGGGGGASNNVSSCGINLSGVNASTTTAGTSGNGGGGTGGTNGSGGTNPNGGSGGAGGGFLTNGTGGQFGNSFTNGGAGGTGFNNNHGGYGGGGSGWHTGGNGGGGGGYSGGGTSGTSPYWGGGSGGSFNSGTNQTSTITTVPGDGMVVITKLCNVNISASTNPICDGGSAVLSTDAVGNILWSTGSTSSSITVAPNTTTTYSVSGSAITGCTTSVLLTVTVNPLPSLSAVVNPAVLCVGKTATMTASGANTYTWSTSAFTQTATANPVITTTYSLSGTNGYGCVNSNVVIVTVNTNALGISSNTSVCTGNHVNLSANGAASYTWSNGSHFQTTQVAPTANTTYTASGTDVHNCILSAIVSVAVNPNPNVTAGANKNTICKGESVTLTGNGAVTYTWLAWNNAVTSGSALTVVLPADVVYTYTVTGTDANGCNNTAIVSVNVNSCSGINELGEESTGTNLYPNPNEGEFMIGWRNPLPRTIEINDITGRVIVSSTVTETKMKVDLKALSSGVYYVKITTGSQAEVIKVVKQ